MGRTGCKEVSLEQLPKTSPEKVVMGLPSREQRAKEGF